MKTTLTIMNRVTKKVIIKSLIIFYLYNNNDNPMNPTSKPSLQPGSGLRWAPEGALQGWRARKGPSIDFRMGPKGPKGLKGPKGPFGLISEWARKGPKSWRALLLRIWEWARKGPKGWRARKGPFISEWARKGPFRMGLKRRQTGQKGP